jgi:hypothetical protein
VVDIRERYPDQIVCDPNSGCWLWVGADDSGFGYGKIYRNKKGRYAHVVSFEMHLGISLVGTKKKVLHSCDCAPCVNPAHLRIGTQADNVADCILRKRRAKTAGEIHGMAKLTEAQALQVMADLKGGMALKAVSAKRGVPYHAVCHISAGKTWRHLAVEGK